MHESRGTGSEEMPGNRRTAAGRAGTAGQQAPSGGSLRQLMVTPTFVFGVVVVTMAVLAFGTTETYLHFSSSGPEKSCGATGCARPDAGHPGRAGHPGGVTAVGTARGPARSPLRRAAPARRRERVKVVIKLAAAGSMARGFLAGMISITDQGGAQFRPWRLSFRYPGARITWMAGATWRTAAGHTLIIEPGPHSPPLRKGATVRFAFAATGAPGVPAVCGFNGARCRIEQ